MVYCIISQGCQSPPIRGNWNTGFLYHSIPYIPEGFPEIPVRTKQVSCGLLWKPVFSRLLLQTSVENWSPYPALNYSLMPLGLDFGRDHGRLAGEFRGWHCIR